MRPCEIALRHRSGSTTTDDRLATTRYSRARSCEMAGFYEAAAHYDADPQPLKTLIDSGNRIDRSDRLGMTLLHYACREGHLDAVVDLVEAGAMLEAQDRDSRTPLHLACMMAGKLQHTRGREHVAISTYLQQEGAATSTQDKYGATPLSYLPQRAKRVGLMTPHVHGPGGAWAVEMVGKTGPVLKGSVAQSTHIHVDLPA